MAKKNDHPVLIWIIIIAVVLLFSKLDWSTPTGQSNKFFADKEKANTNLGDNLNDGSAISETGTQSRTNICTLLNPYILMLQLPNQCQTNGGTWTCSSTEAACRGLTSTTLDCSLAPIQTALTQCRSIGAVGYCDATNVYCNYP